MFFMIFMTNDNVILLKRVLFNREPSINFNLSALNTSERITFICFIVIFSLFSFVGIFLVIIGIVLLIKECIIKKCGVTCYGVINKMSCGYDTTPFKMMIRVNFKYVNPDNNQVECIERKLYINKKKYKRGPYIQFKYYKGHILLDKIIGVSKLPSDFKNRLEINNENK